MVELEPHDGRNLLARALLYLDMGQYAEAMEDLDRAGVQEMTGVAAGQLPFWRGVTHLLLGTTKEAQSDWAQARETIQSDTDACRQERLRAKLALMEGHNNTAREHYTAALEGRCKPMELRRELPALRLLARLFPTRDDVQALKEWFASQLSGELDRQ